MPLVRCKPAKPKPTLPCPACGSTEFWWRQAILLDGHQVGEWLCCRCHQDPRKTSAQNQAEQRRQACGSKDHPWRQGVLFEVPGAAEGLRSLSHPDPRTSPGENKGEQQGEQQCGQPLRSLSPPHIRIGCGEKEPEQQRGEALSSLSHPHTRIGWGEKEPEQHGEHQ